VLFLNIKETVLEVVYAILPVTILVTIMQLTIVKLPKEDFVMFIGGTVMVMLGLILFMIGVKAGFIPMGEMLGSALVSKGKLWLITIFGFILGFSVTVADPDVQVLASQVTRVSEGEIGRLLLIISVAIGVGIFISLALTRIFINLPMTYILIGGYTLAFIISLFAPSRFFALSFDAGGVATGPMIVSFIVSLGVGVMSVTAKKDSSSDSFGLLGLACIGPILAVLILGVLVR